MNEYLKIAPNEEPLKKAEELETSFIHLHKQKNELMFKYNTIIQNPEFKNSITDPARAHEAMELLAVINEVKYKEEKAKLMLEEYKGTLSSENKKLIEEKTTYDMEHLQQAA